MDDIYTKTIQIDSVDDYTRKITSRVTWQTDSRPQHVELVTYVSDWTSALGGDTCSPTFLGNWKEPQGRKEGYGYFDFPSSEGVTDIDTIGKKAYLTTEPSANNKPTFYIVDVRQPKLQPLPMLGSLDTRSAATGNNNGLSAVHVAGQYAYVANRSAKAQLQMINVASSTKPLLAHSYKIIDKNNIKNGAFGISIFYYKQHIFLGTEKADPGYEFNVIDVSNPLDPKWIGGYETGSVVNAIYVKDGVAYIAAADKKQLIVLDVSNVETNGVNYLTSFDSPPGWKILSGNSLALDDGKIYLGRAAGGINPSNDPQLFILEIDNSVSPPNIKQLGFKFLDDKKAIVNGIIVRNNMAFMATGVPNAGFQVWDVSAPVSPSFHSKYNIEQTSTAGMDCEGELIFVGQEHGKGLQILAPKE